MMDFTSMNATAAGGGGTAGGSGQSTGILLQTMLFLASQKMNNTITRTFNKTQSYPNNLDSDSSQEVCYGVYGCFSIAGPWTVQSHRPISLYPESPQKINVRFPVFNLHSRSHPKFIDVNEPYEVRTLGINPKGTIYFIAHGYIDAGDRPWIQTMVNALIDADDSGTATVIVVDWGRGSTPPYTQAAANIRLVGAITAHIIHLLYEELELPNLDKVHMIGHSLGSHLSGYCGMTLQRDFGLHLGRITGMDPAEPLFAQTETVVRLDRTDAKFVDIIHSDASSFVSEGGLGLFEAIGHVDFYPNGGYNQPGCNQNMQHYMNQHDGSFFYGIQNMVACNHIRSYEFFTESILPKCPFLAISCGSYQDFKNGFCFDCNKHDHLCMNFGLKSYESYHSLIETGKIKDSLPISLYLLTNDQKPYCKSHYKVTVRLSSSEESTIHGGEFGMLSVRIHGRQMYGNEIYDRQVHGRYINVKEPPKTENIEFSKESVYYEPGFNYTAVIPGEDVGIPEYASLEWAYKTNFLNPLTWRLLKSPRIYISYIILESMEHRTLIRLCPIFSMPVVQGQSASEFRAVNCEHLPKGYY